MYITIELKHVTLCVIWHHLYNLKNMRNTYGGVLHLVKLKAEASNFTESNTPPWVFVMFFKLYKWYQMAQGISYKHFSVKYGDCTINLSRGVFRAPIKHL